MNINIINSQADLFKNSAYINSIIHPKGGYVAVPSNNLRKKFYDRCPKMFATRTRGFGYVSIPGCKIIEL